MVPAPPPPSGQTLPQGGILHLTTTFGTSFPPSVKKVTSENGFFLPFLAPGPPCFPYMRHLASAKNYLGEGCPLSFHHIEWVNIPVQPIDVLLTRFFYFLPLSFFLRGMAVSSFSPPGRGFQTCCVDGLGTLFFLASLSVFLSKEVRLLVI